MRLTRRELAAVIDHTLLRADATPADVERLVEEAAEFGFWAVCVNPCYVGLARSLAEGSGVRVCTVVGFPLGANLRDVKMREAELAARDGADEIDVVVNIGRLKAGDLDYVTSEVRAVAAAFRAERPEGMVKAIIETGLLTEGEIAEASRAVVEGGADFVKTCTGFGPRGVTVEDVKIIRSAVGDSAGIKAAGGIRTYGDAIRLIEAGASRIGTSRGIAVVSGAPG